MTGAAEVRRRRRQQRTDLLDEARAFVRAIDPARELRAAVVFGSVARGDYHEHSDVDLLVVAAALPARYPDRLRALGWPVPGRIEPVAWTPDEFAARRRAGDLIAVEAEERGVWLVGDAGTAVRS